MDDDKNLKREVEIEKVKEESYKFFYNIWPSINSTLNFFFYYTLKITKGFFRIVMEQFRSK